MTTLLIDNYDSFTWNVYQYLSDLGANVVVFRNDEVTVEECVALRPRNVVISPGPGHPRDAGVSIAVIKAFAGKVPILGVCLGEQSMYELYGGVVKHAGEIVHGKTSPVRHDGRGLFLNVPQGIEVTRYHSLAGDPSTLPECLEITSWTESGIVMGVRHREYVMEGVQFHPESIASEEGMRMMANFLRWDGGIWSTMEVREEFARWPKDAIKLPSGSKGALTGSGGIPLAQMAKLNSTSSDSPENSKSEPARNEARSILQVIEERRKLDVSTLRVIPGHTDEDMMRSLSLGLAPKQIDFRERILASDGLAVMAEIKRASPSKGAIDLTAHAPSQALEYAVGGAAVISVLTEPTWFKGSLEDLRSVRLAIEGLANRPAVLRKDFVVDPYMIYEARLAGADTVLLIVAILEESRLKSLMAVSRTLGMEPLVEVANEQEMRIAVKVGAKVIGVNNRDLHTFTVDAGRTVGLASLVPSDAILVALSGIKGRADVEKYLAAGAKAVLVGESLMRSSDKKAFIRSLRALPGANNSEPSDFGRRSGQGTLVKICGITNRDDALVAAKAGASFLGLVFAEGSPRKVSLDVASDIAKAIRGGDSRSHALRLPPSVPSASVKNLAQATSWYKGCESSLRWAVANSSGPLLVGVFQNQGFEYINHVVAAVGLDLVQLHGSEDPTLVAPLIRAPVVKACHVLEGGSMMSVEKDICSSSGFVTAALLDTGVKGGSGGQGGGTGVTFDWDIAQGVVQSLKIPIWMAGGLDPSNVAKAIEKVRPWCVDVASGVEKAKGVKDHEKVIRFIAEVDAMK